MHRSLGSLHAWISGPGKGGCSRVFSCDLRTHTRAQGGTGGFGNDPWASACPAPFALTLSTRCRIYTAAHKRPAVQGERLLQPAACICRLGPSEPQVSSCSMAGRSLLPCRYSDELLQYQRTRFPGPACVDACTKAARTLPRVRPCNPQATLHHVPAVSCHLPLMISRAAARLVLLARVPGAVPALEHRTPYPLLTVTDCDSREWHARPLQDLRPRIDGSQRYLRVFSSMT